MKKKIKKIKKVIIEQLNNYHEPKLREVRREEDYAGSEYNSDVSDKVKKLILNLINYKDTLLINIHDNNICIECNNIDNIKKPQNNNHNNHIPINDDRFLNIQIDKNGFHIHLGYKKRTRYKDENIFNELEPIIKKRIIEISNENFEEIYTDVLKSSGIMRDNNLEELGI